MKQKEHIPDSGVDMAYSNLYKKVVRIDSCLMAVFVLPFSGRERQAVDGSTNVAYT